MDRIHLPALSVAWKAISAVAVVALVFVAIISVLLKKDFTKLLLIELGVIIGWVFFLLLYGILIYLIRHIKS
jgi:hypothetical protein